MGKQPFCSQVHIGVFNFSHCSVCLELIEPHVHQLSDYILFIGVVGGFGGFFIAEQGVDFLQFFKNHVEKTFQWRIGE